MRDEDEDLDDLTSIVFINGLQSRSGSTYFAVLHSLYQKNRFVEYANCSCLRLSNSFSSCPSLDGVLNDDIELVIGVPLSEALINLSSKDIRTGSSYFRNLSNCWSLISREKLQWGPFDNDADTEDYWANIRPTARLKYPEDDQFGMAGFVEDKYRGRKEKASYETNNIRKIKVDTETEIEKSKSFSWEKIHARLSNRKTSNEKLLNFYYCSLQNAIQIEEAESEKNFLGELLQKLRNKFGESNLFDTEPIELPARRVNFHVNEVSIATIQKIAKRVQQSQLRYRRPLQLDIYAHLLAFTYQLHYSAVQFGNCFLQIEDEESQELRMAVENCDTAKELIRHTQSSTMTTSNDALHNRESYYLRDRELFALSVTDVMIRDALRLRGSMEQSIFRWIAADGCHDYYPDPYATTVNTTKTATLLLSPYRRIRDQWMPSKASKSTAADIRTRRRWTPVDENTKMDSLSPMSHSVKPLPGDTVATDKLHGFANMTNIDALIWSFSGYFSGSQSMERLAKARICTSDVCSILFSFEDDVPSYALLCYQSKDRAYQRKFLLPRGLSGRRDLNKQTLILEFIADESQELPTFQRPTVALENIDDVNADIDVVTQISEEVSIKVDEIIPPTSPVVTLSVLNAAKEAMLNITEEFNVAENAMKGFQKSILRKRRKDALLAKKLKLVQELKEEEKKNSYVAALDENGQEIFPTSSEVSIQLTNLSVKLDKLVEDFASSSDQSDDLLQILEDFILMQENVNGLINGLGV